MRVSDWMSNVCSSYLRSRRDGPLVAPSWSTQSTWPVEPRGEAGGRDERAEPPLGRRGLCALACLAVEAAVVDRDRQRQVVDLPQLLKDQLGKAARVAEDDRRAVLRDLCHHLMHRIDRKSTRLNSSH